MTNDARRVMIEKRLKAVGVDLLAVTSHDEFRDAVARPCIRYPLRSRFQSTLPPLSPDRLKLLQYTNVCFFIFRGVESAGDASSTGTSRLAVERDRDRRREIDSDRHRHVPGLDSHAVGALFGRVDRVWRGFSWVDQRD